ncbi:protoheme IX farnesyltransferase [Rhizobiales bacterium GAS191]|nr:protoheme IX farnesyltransferase [Rhizobiales bacterium GAS191]
MSLASEPRLTSARAGISLASPGDYFALLKPRVMSLVVFTALTGLMLAPSHPHPVIGFISILAIAVGAGAAGCLNMWWDADIDILMSRTRNRPIPAGRVKAKEALGFGLVMSAGSVIVLGLAANWLAASLLAFTIFFYIVVYSMWLKRSTPQNIVIGGAAGALPPMIGFAAATGTVTLESALLFAIIFLWTPPHSWALALFRSDDYARAKVPMLPVVAGRDATRTQILAYTLVLVPIGLLPALLGFAGPAYGLAALLTGAGMIFLAFKLYRQRDDQAADTKATGTKATCTKATDLAAKKLFAFSILYLTILFGVLLAERVVALILSQVAA